MPAPIEIDIYVSPHCNRCQSARRHLLAIGNLDGRSLAIRERNVLDHLESAVAIGVRATPAIVVSGRLVASGSLSRARLRRLLNDALKRE